MKRYGVRTARVCYNAYYHISATNRLVRQIVMLAHSNPKLIKEMWKKLIRYVSSKNIYECSSGNGVNGASN